MTAGERNAPGRAVFFFAGFLLTGIQKKARLGAGRSARGLVWFGSSADCKSKFAGPGRQPGYFFASKEVTKKDFSAALGISVATFRRFSQRLPHPTTTTTPSTE